MASSPQIAPVQGEEASKREIALQKLVTAFICTGIVFLLLPGTFLGVWNLLAISNHQAAHSLSPAWIQAHGQAQMFGWIGTFVIGIGFYSLSKMGRLQPFAVRRGWQSWALWTGGVAMHWVANVYEWHWRILLPVSTVLMLAGFVLFFSTIRKHSPKPSDLPVVQKTPMWMRLILWSTFAFLACLLLNAGVSICVAVQGNGPALPARSETHLLLLSVWGFLVITVWGFNARWLPVFAGLRQANERALQTALFVLLAGLASGFTGFSVVSAALLVTACTIATFALHVFEPGVQPAKVHHIHPSFPYFIRAAYIWLLTAASLAFGAAFLDHNGGVTGASRHALTVGYLGTMVFSIGPRVLPAFCGMRILYSPRLMLYALACLNLGCFLRVASEIPAYELNTPFAWRILPASAIIELAAVALFALNMLATLLQPPAHLQPRKA